jgi:hypothetical protein
MNSSTMSTQHDQSNSFDFPPLPFGEFGDDSEFHDENIQDQDLHFFTFEPCSVSKEHSQQVVDEVKWFWKQAKSSSSTSSSSDVHMR